MLEICELWIVILWYELNPRVRCALGNVIDYASCWNRLVWHLPAHIIIGLVFWNVHRQMTEYFGFDNFWSTRHSASSKFECKNLVCFIKLYKKNKFKERRLFISVSWASVDCVFLSLLFLSCVVDPHSQMLIFLSSILTNTCLCFSIFYPLGMFLSWLCLLYLSWLCFLYFPDFGLKLKYFAMSQARFPSLHIFSSLLTCVCLRNAFFCFVFNKDKTELKNNLWLPWLLPAVFDGVARFQTLPFGSALSARNHIIRVFTRRF